MPILEFPDENPIVFGLWDYMSNVEGLNAQGPQQLVFDNAKKDLQTAAEQLEQAHWSAAKDFGERKDKNECPTFQGWVAFNDAGFMQAVKTFEASVAALRQAGMAAYGMEYQRVLSNSGDSRAEADEDNLWFF